jgi:hypothetical protein
MALTLYSIAKASSIQSLIIDSIYSNLSVAILLFILNLNAYLLQVNFLGTKQHTWVMRHNSKLFWTNKLSLVFSFASKVVHWIIASLWMPVVC